ncbi:hypothetical protein Tsubulata_046400 [Turnera subulata]|uniref:Uncharacterized protein n=1 Tax=Turnera subulata TaxID=218843 RepID=A0A9Q0FY45_9ROSI|nr:hypothetical protein Tsubulata_046400 [Turnera subulata]
MYRLYKMEPLIYTRRVKMEVGEKAVEGWAETARKSANEAVKAALDFQSKEVDLSYPFDANWRIAPFLRNAIHHIERKHNTIENPALLGKIRRDPSSSIAASTIPREIMGYKEFPFVAREGEGRDPRRFPVDKEVLAYLKDYARGVWYSWGGEGLQTMHARVRATTTLCFTLFQFLSPQSTTHVARSHGDAATITPLLLCSSSQLGRNQRAAADGGGCSVDVREDRSLVEDLASLLSLDVVKE